MSLKNIRYKIENLIVKFGFWFFGSMKPQKASDVAALISKFVGKKISVHKLAYNNISKAMPDLSHDEKLGILDNMWDNLGRIVGEFSHIAKCKISDIDKLVETSSETQENIKNMAKQKGGIIFGAHIGNWEVGPKFFLNNNIAVSTVYRPLNNPYVEKITAAMRGVEMIEKGVTGSRKIIEVIKNGGFVIILADQKVSEGEPVQFFHDKAITTTSIAKIALKYDVPLIPARSIRIDKKFKFCIDVDKALTIKKTHNNNDDILSLTRNINSKLESWIRQYPSQWFWVHNRWKQ